MSCKVVLLHNHLSLLDDCCELLNTEWKRSYGIRSRFLKQSNDKLPCSLVLLVDETVVGHIRLTGVIGESYSLFMTSVIISPDMRGKGFGKKLMFLTEEYALKRGYTSLCLSSDEKEKFYEKCGYFKCQPVQQSHNTNLNEKLSILQEKQSHFKIVEKKDQNVLSNSSKLPASSPSSSVPPTPSSVPPPPPFVPPPPSAVFSSEEKNIANKVWMRKNLV